MRSPFKWGLLSSATRTRMALLLAVVLLPSCRASEPLDESDTVLATVNGVDITRGWFESSYVNLLIHTGANDNPANRYLHLDNMIDDILLEGEARTRKMDRDSSFLAYEVLQKKKVLGSRFLGDAFMRKQEPLGDSDIRLAFSRSKTKVVVRHLFFLDQASAMEAFERLQAGRDFVDEAQDTYGLSVYDSTAGFLGPMRYYGVDDAFAETAWSLKVGEVSKPVKSRFGYHIIRVENRHTNPILTETEYQSRKEGIRAREQQRKLRFEGDRFVHEFMSGLDVRVNPEAVAGLQLIVEGIENSVGPQAVSVFNSEMAIASGAALTSGLTPDTPLLSFVWRGDTYAFTLSEYLAWLPELPFPEARHRTAASVGRALRNEVLSMEGFRRGLDDDRTRAELQRSTIRFLAVQLRRSLRADTAVVPDESFVREAFDRLGYASRVQTRATFWIIPFATREQAIQAKKQINERSTRPSEFSGFKNFVDRDLQDLPDWRVHARTSPLETVVVAGLSQDRWFVLNVESRTIKKPAFEDFREEIAAQSAPYMAEYQTLQELRSHSGIQVDTTLFEQMMTLE